MKHSAVGRAYLAAGFAVVLMVAGTAAVQAQATGGQSAAAGGTVSSAKSAVIEHSARFGFGPHQTLTVKAVYRDANGTTVRFARSYRGFPVVNGEFIVHLDRAGHYRYGSGMTVAGLPTSARPTVARAAAVSTSQRVLSYAAASVSTRLAYFGTPHGSPLVWQVSTLDKSGIQGDVTYVSATRGRVVASWPTVLTDDAAGADPYAGANDVGTGKTLYSGQVSLNDVKRGFVTHYVLKDRSRGKQRTYDANNSGQVGSGTLFKDTNNVWGNGTGSSRESAGADAAYGVGATWDYYLNTYGRSGIGDDGIAARAFVHYSTNYANANWSDSCFCMIFGDGNAAIGWGPLVSLDVGGHEMTHGVTSRTAGLIYSGESGGLNESTSDVMGTQVEWYANNANDVPDYMIGEEFYLDFDPETNYLRRMDQPSMDGASKDCWYDGVGNVDVHYSSGVGNHLFYLLSEGSGAKTINGLHYDSPTCNGSTVTGIGHDKAAAIWYKALTEEWVPTTNYHDARVGMLNAAANLYGPSSAEYKAVNKAWAAVNVVP